MQSLTDYFALQQQIFDYFGYVQDWRILPLDDARDCYWRLDGEGPGSVRFADSVEQLDNEEAGDYYENEIYTQRFLPKWVYRGPEFTMVVVDTHTDGNQYLQIFANDKERPSPGRATP